MTPDDASLLIKKNFADIICQFERECWTKNHYKELCFIKILSSTQTNIQPT